MRCGCQLMAQWACVCVFDYFDFASDPQSSTTGSACLSCILRRLHEPRVLHCVLRRFLSVLCNSRVFHRVIKSYNLFSIGLQSSWGGFVLHRVSQGGYTKLWCWCCVFVGFASIYGALRLASRDSLTLTNARWCSTTSAVWCSSFLQGRDGWIVDWALLLILRMINEALRIVSWSSLCFTRALLCCTGDFALYDFISLN
jgi:hypothetical protein